MCLYADVHAYKRKCEKDRKKRVCLNVYMIKRKGIIERDKGSERVERHREKRREREVKIIQS